ncbi:c-type cytochrome biogenesis protein CcsB [Lentzea flaviverrucosa]|uniref:Cytochrome c-type biogenesis protein CcsB n=1 Tax=Lentzea flaviverrucosa TaxID=200379 RepID=A0A1H9P230_9PSEU|nr:c-type cytochrome biogenesis protein CcsB [Lentzea flaviverrucosa]RDI30000.1 cytochrome c-type biogenesis protein CcsB [Lentzea flaviverrucosa]SER42238.1 cytochrome c-type biogenesis protein CcsB [Lentzea flaviverrucosa]
MPVDETLATYSDWLYRSALGVYLFAVLLYAVEQAFARAPRKAEVMAGAGGPDVLTDAPKSALTRSERIGRMGAAMTVLGAVLHLGSLVMRGLSAGRAPWGNMYEYMSLLCLAAVVTWIVLMAKFPIRRLGAFVLTPILVLLFLGGTVLYAESAPVQPALRSYWLVIHVSVISISSGMLLIPGVTSILYLLKDTNSDRFPKLPSADVLDRMSYRITVLAFPLFTAGIILGAIWAEAAWGRFWGWDPKETVAFVAWVVYAAYLHARATAGWRGRGAAWINVVGFALNVFNLFFINLVTSGLHSYAGL